jgi:hypothetical protein
MLHGHTLRWTRHSSLLFQWEYAADFNGYATVHHVLHSKTGKKRDIEHDFECIVRTGCMFYP